MLKKVFQLFKTLHSKNLMHSDLKPQNIILYGCSDISNNIYDVKLIDFGAATFEYAVLKAYTMDYFIPNINDVTITSKEQRVKYEYYTLGRTIQRVMLSSVSKQENIEMSELFKNNSEAIQKSIVTMKKFYSEKLVQVIADLLEMKVPLTDVEEKLNELKSDFIMDSEQLVDNMVYDKMSQEITQKKPSKVEEQLLEYYQLELHDKVIQVFRKMPDEKYKSIKLVTYYIKSLYGMGDFEGMNNVVELVENDYEKDYNQEMSEDYYSYVFVKIKGHPYY